MYIAVIPFLNTYQGPPWITLRTRRIGVGRLPSDAHTPLAHLADPAGMLRLQRRHFCLPRIPQIGSTHAYNNWVPAAVRLVTEKRAFCICSRRRSS